MARAVGLAVISRAHTILRQWLHAVLAKVPRPSGVAAILLVTSCVEYDPNSPTKMASFAASQAFSCPEQRLTVVDAPAAAPAGPPEDVARDPQRLALWSKSQPAQRDRHFVVSGCGRNAQIVCRWTEFMSGTSPTAGWGCAPEEHQPIATSTATDGSTPEELSSGASVSVVAATPELLEALATQMDNSGQTAAAHALRARAQQLRAGATSPSPGATSSPADASALGKSPGASSSAAPTAR